MNGNFLHRTFPWVIYPFGVGMAIYLHVSMQSWGIDLQISTYTPVFLAVGMITLFEIYFPNLQQWRPEFDDVKNDVIYMLFVQALLPKALAFLSALILLRYTQNSGLPISSYWPHHWPYWIQGIVMVLSADFLRYWFHVACHKNGFLWRFHAVHHSPGKLYWVNTGRFHPIEKAAQFLFDALPFILLGISEKDVVGKNRDTRFGKEHKFNEIDSYEKFTRLVPVQTYDSLRPYFVEQEATKENIINAEKPIMYAVTSGTTGASKYIPILKETIKCNKKHQKLFTYSQYRDNPSTFSGKILGIVSPAIEGYTELGTPYGSVSGVLYKNIPSIMKSKYVLPVEVFSVEDYELKYKLILRIALAYKDVTYLVSANPSTFLMLHSQINRYFDEFVDDLEQGIFREQDKLSAEVQNSIAPKLRANQWRAEELRELYARKRAICFADIWPFLQTVVTWTGGSCGIALDAVRQGLPQGTKVVELGYMATEVRGTITIDINNNLGLPTIQDNFFEFVEREQWDNDEREFLTIDQISNGKEYYVFITTSSGLYRYHINDVLQVTGKIEQTPTLRFRQKGKGATNITGEKLYECQVLEAVNSAEREFNFTSVFFIMLASTTSANYELFLEITGELNHPLETIREYIEAAIGKLNIEYASKSASGRLKALTLECIKKGTGEAFKKKCLEDGQKESQFKVIILQYKDAVKFSFYEYVSESAGSIK